MNDTIYSAKYSNVDVLEFVTPEGPIMRRKNDSWINATHILKIAKFPKAKRTRILEKDVQTGIHEKVQGGYGKYQGTYVPLQIGEQIAKNFEVYDILKPIFEFRYVEGESKTPPPAPKHSHASALNIAKRQASIDKKQQKEKSQLTNTIDEPRKRGRPKRSQTLSSTPSLKHQDTTPIGQHQGGFGANLPLPPPLSKSSFAISRQNTESDIKPEDLQAVETDEDEMSATTARTTTTNNRLEANKRRRFDFDSQPDLLTSKELFGVSRNSFEKKSAKDGDFVPLQPYHQPSINLSQDNQIFNDYFQNLLSFFLDDNDKIRNHLPENLLNPPRPLSKIHINQSIDNEGNTIFHWACSLANLPIVEFLINTFKEEVSSNIRNNQGETPLMFLVKFNNSFTLQNFPEILNLLIDSLLKVDSNGRTILHHIIENKKEKISKYYLECLMDNLMKNEDEKFHLIYKFLNHQNSDGNTAFHIASYNLRKKLIKVFINYHKFIDFSLQNLVQCTIEDYLASHNFVLRLDNANDDEMDEEIKEGLKIENNDDRILSLIEDGDDSQITNFEYQLNLTKEAIRLHNQSANEITGRLSQLAFSIDEELNKKDEVILLYYKILKKTNEIKLNSQRKLLSFFKYENLIDDLIVNISQPTISQDSSSAATTTQSTELYIDHKRDLIIQSEIHRLINDLTFQTLHKQEEVDELQRKFKNMLSMTHLKQIKEAPIVQVQGSQKDEAIELCVELQQEIIKRKQLVSSVLLAGLDVPPKSNLLSKDNQINGEYSIVQQYSNKDDKLYKYVKLISVSCGMKFEEIEKSIDLIEQSLTKN